MAMRVHNKLTIQQPNAASLELVEGWADLRLN